MKALLAIADASLAEDVRAVLAARQIEAFDVDDIETVDVSTLEFDIAIAEVADAASGLEAVRAVRRKGPGVPLLVVLPGGTNAETELLTAGAADFAVKPVSRSSLDARISILARRAVRPADVSWHGLPLATIVESIADVIEINSPEVVFEYVNPAFEDVMGYTREEAIGSTPARLIASGAHPPEFFAEMERELSGGKIWRGVLVSCRSSNEMAQAAAFAKELVA